LNEKYADDHPDDPYGSDNDFIYGNLAGFPETYTGIGLLFLGGPMLAAGVSLLIPGIRMNKRAEAALNYLHQKPTAPVAFTGLNLSVNRDSVGFGMALSF